MLCSGRADRPLGRRRRPAAPECDGRCRTLIVWELLALAVLSAPPPTLRANEPLAVLPPPPLTLAFPRPVAALGMLPPLTLACRALAVLPSPPLTLALSAAGRVDAGLR